MVVANFTRLNLTKRVQLILLRQQYESKLKNGVVYFVDYRALAHVM